MSDLLALTLFALLPGLWRAMGVPGKAPPRHDPQAGETLIATLYLRRGRLRLRRRRAA